MGSGPDAVVDPDLKVPTVPNLFICDGSILPSLTTGPVNAAIVAVAERGAERIAEIAEMMPAMLPDECKAVSPGIVAAPFMQC